MFALACCPASNDGDTAESLRFYVEKFSAAKRAIPQERVQVCTTQHISKSFFFLLSFHGMTISQCWLGLGGEAGAVGGFAPVLQSFPVNMLINELLALFHM